MEKPGWGIVAVIVVGIVLLSVFLIFPDRDWKDLGADQNASGPRTFGDEHAKSMARDTMKVVDGSESTSEIVQGFARPAGDVEYDPKDRFITGDQSIDALAESRDVSLEGYLHSLSSGTALSLFESISNGDGVAVRMILDRDGDLHQRDQDENAALHHAAAQGSVEIGALLIRYGADVNAVNGDGHTPLDVARSAGNTPFEELLLAYGARPGGVSDAQPVSVSE